jgi:hypothetical protein
MVLDVGRMFDNDKFGGTTMLNVKNISFMSSFYGSISLTNVQDSA